MSIELFVYSEKTSPPDLASLSRALKEKGWHTASFDPITLKEKNEGDLEDQLIYGARDPQILARVRDLLSKGDEKSLERLLQDHQAGGCEIFPSMDFNAEEEYGKDFRDQFPAEIRDRVARAKSQYAIRSSAGRSGLASELQAAVWKCIGQLVDGLLEDPQSGSHVRLSQDGAELVFEVEREEGSPADSLLKYFDAAKAAGFPVEVSENREVSLHTEKLAPEQLERLLKFTRDHFGPQEPEGQDLVMMILDEYREKKGKTFARQNAEWLSQIQQKYASF